MKSKLMPEKEVQRTIRQKMRVWGKMMTMERSREV